MEVIIHWRSSLGAVQDRWEDSENILLSWLPPEISSFLQN